MVGIVNNVGSTSGSTSVRPVAASAPVAAASAAVAESVAVKSSGQLKPISPVIRQDSVSGVLITQYLSTEGQVKAQFPSTVAVAYLRAGLTENGALRKDNADAGSATPHQA